MTIFIASDHGGFEQKKEIIEHLSKSHDVEDLGPAVYREKDDYVDYAVAVAQKVQSDSDSRGILLCKSGIGMYIAANRFARIRAAEVRSVEEAKIDRAHHNSNILVIGSNVSEENAVLDIVTTWLKAGFEGGRHERRLRKLSAIDRAQTSTFQFKPTVIPAILSSELTDYRRQIEVYSSFTSYLNIDVMDGKFVENTTPSLKDIMNSINDCNVTLTVHLMVENPEEELSSIIADRRVPLVYVHLETIEESFLHQEYPFDIGLVISPHTDVESFKQWILRIPVVQIMTIEPGAQGNAFQPELLETITTIREWGFTGEIHIDGGVSLDTISQITKYHPDVLNVGSAISHSQDPANEFAKVCELSHPSSS